MFFCLRCLVTRGTRLQSAAKKVLEQNFLQFPFWNLQQWRSFQGTRKLQAFHKKTVTPRQAQEVPFEPAGFCFRAPVLGEDRISRFRNSQREAETPAAPHRSHAKAEASRGFINSIGQMESATSRSSGFAST